MENVCLKEKRMRIDLLRNRSLFAVLEIVLGFSQPHSKDDNSTQHTEEG